MITRYRKIWTFGGSAFVTATVWAAFRPAAARQDPPVVVISNPVAVERNWNKKDVEEAIVTLKNATDARSLLKTARKLAEVPKAQVPGILAGMQSEMEHDFSIIARILLAQWASNDGGSAIHWAWQSFRSGNQWRNAFKEIGPAWAAHDPSGLYRWTVAARERRKERWPDSVSLIDAEASDQPLLESGGFRDITTWLVHEKPELAFRLILTESGGSYDSRLVKLLTSADGVREAMLAFDNTDPKQSFYVDNLWKCLQLRWYELDPEGFRLTPDGKSFPVGEKLESATAAERWRSSSKMARADAANRLIAEVDVTSREATINTISEAWASSDPDACAGWLDSLPPEELESVNKARASSLAPYELNHVLDQFDELSSEKFNKAIVTAFDAWTQAHPGERADRSGWPASRVEAWEDLEALQPEER